MKTQQKLKKEFRFCMKNQKQITLNFTDMMRNKKMAPVLFLISCVGLYMCSKKMYRILFDTYKDFKKVENAFHSIKKDFTSAKERLT